MAQAPHKPEPTKSESKKEEMKVPVPGSPPKPSVSEQPADQVPDATKAEQEEGKKAQEIYAERLKAEQEAGQAMVAQNEKISGVKPKEIEEKEEAVEPAPSKPNPLHGAGHSKE
jgi:hypothetical protein